MKTSITMISFEDYARAGKMSVEDFIDLCSSYDVDAVDILEYFWRDKEEEIKKIPDLLKDNGLEIGAFCVGNNFIVPSEERQKQIDYVKEGINTAVRLGANKLRIFGGGTKIPENIKKEERMGIITESIGKCIDYAKDNNVTLVLENHGGIPVTSDEMLQIIKEVNSPHLKVNFDIGNFLSSGNEDPVEAVERLYPYVDFVHAKDLVKVDSDETRYEACITGEGIVPISSCLQFLKGKGYDGYVSLEYEAWEKTESMIGAKKSIENLKDIISKL